MNPRESGNHPIASTNRNDGGAGLRGNSIDRTTASDSPSNTTTRPPPSASNRRPSGDHTGVSKNGAASSSVNGVNDSPVSTFNNAGVNGACRIPTRATENANRPPSDDHDAPKNDGT